MSNQLKAGLSARHIRFMALGSAVGTGLFMGSASSIQAAGPSVIFAYIVAGAMVYLVMRALGEMIVREPDKSFGHHASHHLGPMWGFTTGWMYVLEMIVVCLADVSAFAIYMGFWFPQVAAWIWVLSIIFFIAALNLCAVRIFGEMEFWLSSIKILAIVAMIAGGALIMVFGFGEKTGGATGVANLWAHGGWLPNGWLGFLMCFTMVIYAFGGIEVIGVSASEAQNPEKVIPRAINAVPTRILLFYVLTMFVLLSIFPWNEVGKQGSPFTLIFDSLGFTYAAHVLNMVVASAAVSAINSDVFGAGRMLYSMAKQGQAPRVFAVVSHRGVPYAAALLMGGFLLLGVVLNWLLPEDIFKILASVAAFATIWVWLMILFAQIAMRRSMTAEDIQQLQFPVPFGLAGQYVAVVFLLAVTGAMWFFSHTALLVGLGWLAVVLVCWRVFQPQLRQQAAARQEGLPGYTST